jgi:sugar transferase EpsL
MKRCLDVLVASVGLIVLTPAIGAVALAILLALGRPVLFRQQRPGLHGRPFIMLKFRTMREAAGPDGTPLSELVSGEYSDIHRWMSRRLSGTLCAAT